MFIVGGSRQTPAKAHEGAVALEFLMLFPFVVAMLYASAIYGIVFFSQYRLQNVVDRAVAAALYVDRSADHEDEGGLESAVEGRANSVLADLLSRLPAPISGAQGSEDGFCGTTEVGGVKMIRCEVTYNYRENPIVPVMSFGMLGTFPPLPDTLTAEAYVAF